MRQTGGEIVQGSDPEYAAYRTLTGHTGPSDLDSSFTGYPGVRLVRRHIEVERKRREEEATRRERSLRGGTAEQTYVAAGRSHPDEMEAAGKRGLSSLRFARRDHGTQLAAFDDGGSERTLEVWDPSSGIVRDE